MLARTAQGLYWMSRYLERAHHLCGLLRLQSESLIDRPIGEINFGWKRIYDSLGRLPPSGEHLIVDSEDFTLADSYTLTDDLTFERTNLDSVWSCFAEGRENARQVRRAIGSEMWSCLNLAYLRLRHMTIQDIWGTSPEGFYSSLVSDIDRFAGVASATMYRDEGWRFMLLGQRIERAQLLCSLLLTQIDLDESGDDSSDADWTSLLRLYHAFEAYGRRYSVEVDPDSVIDLLVTDSRLPGSLIRSLDIAAGEISTLGDGPDPESSDSTRRMAQRLTNILHSDWTERHDRKDLLIEASTHARSLHTLINETYFEYPYNDMPKL